MGKPWVNLEHNTVPNYPMGAPYIYIYTAARFGSVSNWNALFAGYTVCNLQRVHGVQFTKGTRYAISEQVHTVLHV